MRERIGDCFHHSPHNNGQSLIKNENSYYALYRARLTRIVNKLPLKNKYSLSSIGMDCPPNN
jgi:S-adenosylmethionine:diacylglycerol 3-amino-3-carboxypropyl transferase